MEPQIPFNKQFFTGKELAHISEVINDGSIASDGKFTLACARLLEGRYGIHKVLMTPSCTAALEVAAMLCGLAEGDEVIMPSFTFVSTANAVMRAGARPVFVDIREDTLNVDEQRIEAAITPRTKAIVPVHYAGVGCEMDRILSLARENNLFVIEDAAQGVNAFYRGRALGSMGHLAAYSFHETKNYVCGEGGALCVNATEFVGRAEIMREKGTNRAQFIRGEIDKYTWVDVGSSGLPSELSCAFLYAQLEEIDRITFLRRERFNRYLELLTPLADADLIQLPLVPDGCDINYHIFFVLVRDEKTRRGLMKDLKQNGISAAFHYVPLHTAPMGRMLGYRAGDLPATENISGRLLRLPLYPDLSADDQSRVVQSVRRSLESTLQKSAPAVGR